MLDREIESEGSNSGEDGEKEEKRTIVFCVIAALAGIAVLLAFARASAPVEKSISELSSEDAGRLVLVKGRVESVSFSRNENAFMKICAGSCITAFIPKYLVAKMNASTLDLNALKKNAGTPVIMIEGVVEERENKLSLRLLTPDAIDVVGYSEK